MPSLVLINGAPASGKSTMARLLVDQHPLALLLDIDTVRGLLGQWLDDPASAGIAARRLALAMIRTHLGSGHDVVVPQFLARLPFILELEQAAADSDARFVEIALVSSPDEAAARFLARAGSPDSNHWDAARLQQSAGAQPIDALYNAMIEVVCSRPATRFVESVPNDIEATFATLHRLVQKHERE